MKKNTDCLIIGPKEVGIIERERLDRMEGTESGQYRRMGMEFIRYKNVVYSIPSIFDKLCKDNSLDIPTMDWSEIFSGAIACLGSYLHKRGYSIDYVNSFNQEKNQLAEKLKDDDILTIAITTTFYISIYPISEIIHFIRRYNKTAKIIVGGPFIYHLISSYNSDQIQNALKFIGADYYVHNIQGEKALAGIVDSLKNGRPIQNVCNIYYKSDSKFIPTEMNDENNTLQENLIDWDLFKDNIPRVVPIRTSVSCPFSCAFCRFPKYAGKFNSISVDEIEQDLSLLIKACNISNIYFVDDTLNVPIDRFKDFLRMLAKNKFNLKWNSFLRCQFVDRETVELMKETGCQSVLLGIESGSQQILDNMNKAVKVEDYKKGMSLLNEYDIVSIASFITGFPGETSETAQETIDFINDTKPTFYKAHIWFYDTLAPIYKQREAYQITGMGYEWKHSTMDANGSFETIKDIFEKVTNSIWFPDFNLGHLSVFQFLMRGIKIDQIKNFIKLFDDGLEEMMADPSELEVSEDLMNRMNDLVKTFAKPTF
jgi:Fe-S oxidoreductase